ncbi:hypothetical protein [Brevundimonas sp. DC300-4]|uniref:hypothetical protein n=1 Tax=Brevundimonas sp. DC300-4 TaxID=2804594 RepID=UPI003CEA9781
MSDDPSSGKPNQMIDPFQDPPGRSGISPVILGGVAVAAIALAAGAWFVMRSPSDGDPTSTVAIVGENINCRAEPNGNANVIRQVSGYAEFESKKAEGDWVQIGTGDQACWANATYVVLNADLKAGEGEQPRLVEYLKGQGNVAAARFNNVGLTTLSDTNVIAPQPFIPTVTSIVGIWSYSALECSGSGVGWFFHDNGEVANFDLEIESIARYTYDGSNLLVRWDAWKGSEVVLDHPGGQLFGAVEWQSRDRITITWQPYGDQNRGSETLIRCPTP